MSAPMSAMRLSRNSVRNLDDYVPLASEVKEKTWQSQLWDRSSENFVFNVEGHSFNGAVGCVIVVNAIILGFEADWGDELLVFVVFENMFAMIFTCEMILRIAHFGLCGYLKHPLNCFDGFLVITTLLEMYVLPSGGSTWAPRLLRSFRLLRVMRIIRLFRMFHALGIMLDAFVTALSTVSWVGLLAVILMYICAIFVTMTIGHDAPSWGNDADQIDGYFGSMGASMATLFIIITLAEWDVIARLIAQQVPGLLVYVLFAIYITLTAFTMVSLITGIISEALISAQLQDEENRIKQAEKDQKELRGQLSTMFASMDSDGSGSLSTEEIQDVLKANNQSLMTRLQLLDIDMEVEDVMALVESLKVNPDDEVKIDEVIGALEHLTGNASASALYELKVDVRKIQRQNQDDFEMLGARTEEVRKSLGEVELRLGSRLSTMEQKLDLLCAHVMLGLERDVQE